MKATLAGSEFRQRIRSLLGPLRGGGCLLVVGLVGGCVYLRCR